MSAVPSADALAIQPVSGRAGLKRFLDVARPIYRDDPHWVEPLRFERLMHLDARKNPFLRDIEIEWLVATRGGRDVGRISAQIDRKHLARYNDATGHFGFLEAIDDPDVFAALTGAAASWLKQRGMRRATGPFNPSINDECGLLVDGFDRIPSMMMGHHRPYYGPRLEALGWSKAQDLTAYWFDVTAPWPKLAARIIDRLDHWPGLTVRNLDMRRYQDEIGTVCDIFNDAWADNWNFVPFGDDEAQYLAQSIRPLIRPEHAAIGEIDGEPAAMVVTLPNLNRAIHDLHGRLLPFGWAKLLWRLKVQGVDEWRMPLMGVRKRHQGTSRGAALALGVIAKVKNWHQQHGTKAAELSWIAESNPKMHEIIRLVGATPYKTYRIYEKALP